uniref:hypothetical protein n=1 Tax=Arthrobacter sp. TaxID=1667 RepID=UPI00258564C1
MDYDRSMDPRDRPGPPTPDEVAAACPVSMLTFADQAAVEEAAVSRWGDTRNGQDVMASATLSYTVSRNPADHGDPANLARLPEEIRAQLEFAPPWPLPDWLVQWRSRMRYPLLWDAVRTTWTSGTEPRRTVEALAVEHLDYIVMNQFTNAQGRPAGPPAGGGLPDGELYAEDFFPGGLIPAELPGPDPGGGGAQGVAFMVDGASVPGVRLDSNPHVLGLGVDLGGKVLTAAVPREWRPLLRLEFATRKPAGADASTPGGVLNPRVPPPVFATFSS